MSDIKSLSGFVWSIAEILRGDFKQSEYGKVMLPFVVLRRLDCLLEDSKKAVLEAEKSLPDTADDATRDMILYGAVGGNVKVYNLSRFTFDSLRGQDPGQLHQNLIDYITKFSSNVRDILLDKFRFTDQLKRLKGGGILWNVFERFCEIDLHPDKVSNLEMGYLFEELIRRFSEISNETAGEHFTPREVIRLIVDLLIANDDAKLSGRGIIRQVYDPACGTGGMLALTEEALKDFNRNIRVELFGQELNDESFGICKSDMLVTGHDPEQIAFGNTLTQDAHAGKKFHYMLSNPPYGVDWKKYQEPIKAEAESMGFGGRFGAGTPRISDGQLLFLQHMISKMRDDEDGSRIGIVMNGSPLFTGGAQSGESEIRRWMLDNLRQLMVCERGRLPRSERQLADMKRGEIRWNERDKGWEVLIPSVAFKNANSSYFGSKPFRLILPDLGGLYDHIETYIDRHRRALLGGAEDPGTFFVKTVKTTSKDASYDQNTFYEAWRLTIQRYGIYNPYTGRGAIPGLLPHGPHNVRDVLATHILKQTGSFEQASYAIQDTPDMVAHHYGRFLPQDKAALAARILNQVWEAA